MRARLTIALVLVSCAGAPTPRTESVTASDDPAWMSAVRDASAHAAEQPRTYEIVESLTDAAGPRLAGSPGDALAVAWAVREMTELGFANVHAEPVMVRVWDRGEERVDVIAPVPHRLAAAALGGSVGTPDGGIEAEVVRVESLEALSAMDRSAIEGRIVFVDRRMTREHDGSGYGEAIGVRIGSASAAAALGAVAVLIRSIGTDSARFAHTGVMHYADDVARIPAASISNADADTLGRWIASGAPVRVRMSLGCRDAGQAQSANVVGEVIGTEHPEQIILLGAHLDSWDLGRGAIDDGAGVGIVMEALRQIATAETRPLRTVRVVLFANEENGGAGADAYRAAHASELEQHFLAMESDFGDGAVYALRGPVPLDASAPWRRIVRLMEPLGVVFDEARAHGGADVGDLAEAGVPLADALQDGTRYFDIHHTANDVMTIVDRSSLDQAMRAVLTIAYAASLDPELERIAAPQPRE